MLANLSRFTALSLCLSFFVGCDITPHLDVDPTLTDAITAKYAAKFEQARVTEIDVVDCGNNRCRQGYANVTVNGKTSEFPVVTGAVHAYSVTYAAADAKGPAVLMVYDNADRTTQTSTEVIQTVSAEIDRIFRELDERKRIADTWKDDQQRNTN